MDRRRRIGGLPELALILPWGIAGPRDSAIVGGTLVPVRPLVALPRVSPTPLTPGASRRQRLGGRTSRQSSAPGAPRSPCHRSSTPDVEAEAAGDVMARVDALCLPGGPDVSPLRVRRGPVPSSPHQRASRTRRRRPRPGAAAVALDKPVLAICRGHQVLNVALGGTLHQHLPDLVGRRNAAGHFHHHNDIDVVAESKTATGDGNDDRPRALRPPPGGRPTRIRTRRHGVVG